ncbi:nitrite reductase/ring-hydroxylating ferredoxin subunit [Stackebrandtia albiflava]|uniref:Nitrite reductase/ring-hydroxylating ferredoxin subunit n=1 Tax=Stackebrandtia albiflava TaxID=406432 RepID=A0A562VDQ4_9ACTN|nr:Rieske (2Fe-2S) protein [Stackebrandtia albiflava]TWJ16013.1 nitrite reductase/ring-hydroxylating ferredoxin subunit [Stackebrandtia albiflava]
MSDADERLAMGVLKTTRRRLLCGAMGISAAAVLAACGSGEDEPATGGDGSEAASSDTPPADGEVLATVDEVPVGGGIVTENLVIVQPEEGRFVAFDRACPHQANPLDAPVDGVITCPLHQSQFTAADGSLIEGPAQTGLTEVPIKVSGTDIVLA